MIRCLEKAVKRDQQITKTLLKTFEDVSTSSATVIFSKMLSTSKDDNFCPWISIMWNSNIHFKSSNDIKVVKGIKGTFYFWEKVFFLVWFDKSQENTPEGIWLFLNANRST